MNDQERYQHYLAGREWGLKKEAVRKRCKGTCERCRHFPMSHVHHLTYIRKYNELLEDLQGLCVGCHEFTHGKSDQDPMLKIPVKVCGRVVKSAYLAGKVSHYSWRDDIAPDAVFEEGTDEDEWREEWPVIRAGIKIPDGRSLDYAGPFIIRDKHLCYRPGHLFGDSGNTVTLLGVPGLCCDSIGRADLVFAWIDTLDCFGTIAEIGYAKAHNKLILIAGPEFYRDLWFVYAMADRISFGSEDAQESFYKMFTDVSWSQDMARWREWYTSNLHRDPIDQPEEPDPEEDEDASWSGGGIPYQSGDFICDDSLDFPGMEPRP